MNNKRKYGLIGVIIAGALSILLIWWFANGVGTDHQSEPMISDTTDDQSTSPSTSSTTDNPLSLYLKEQNKIMEEMLEDMEEEKREPEGIASVDYLEGMVEHQEAGIDLAKAYLKYGSSNEELRQIAGTTIRQQTNEIQKMEQLSDEISANEDKDPDTEQRFLSAYGQTLANHQTTHPLTSAAQNIDQAFIDSMISHHRISVDISGQILDCTTNPNVRMVAENILQTQEDEIKHLEAIRKSSDTINS